MQKKIFILLFLLSFPSVFYVILTTGKHNFVHLPFYGEKKIAANGKDTIYHSIPPFKFVNQDGDTITDKMLEGKIYIADYFSTTCKKGCQKLTTELLRLQEKFSYTKATVKIVSFTANPEEDSVPVLKAYSKLVHADSKMWNFVTGDKKQLIDLAHNGYSLNTLGGNDGTDEFMHSKFFILVDKEKHIRGIFDGTNIQQTNNLLDAIKVLIAEYYIKDNAKKKISDSQ